jgi:hypothetical protein
VRGNPGRRWKFGLVLQVGQRHGENLGQSTMNSTAPTLVDDRCGSALSAT